jgi:hypothetical protein
MRTWFLRGSIVPSMTARGRGAPSDARASGRSGTWSAPNGTTRTRSAPTPRSRTHPWPVAVVGTTTSAAEPQIAFDRASRFLVLRSPWKLGSSANATSWIVTTALARTSRG